MTTLSSLTKARLKLLGHPFIGVELKDGTKKFGYVTKSTQYKIYFKDRYGDELDVPKKLISRALLLIKGENKDDGPARISKKNQSQGKH